MSAVFIPLSGFLGAGKTTLMLKAAELLKKRGLKAVCIANDQGGMLVDAMAAAQRGFPVGQVAGGCFCCKFDELTETIHALLASERPDVIIAEAAGSCTDLEATVVRPLLVLHGDRIRPLGVTTVIDPWRLRQWYGRESRFTPEIDYIFRKQLEDASCLLLNKSDLLPPDEAETLLAKLRADIPDVPIAAVSSRVGTGIAAWLDRALAGFGAPHSVLDVDYDVYAAGEAQLGWLNMSLTLEGSGFDAAEACEALMNELSDALAAAGAEIAHAKLWAQNDSDAMKLNVVRGGDAPAAEGPARRPWPSDRAAVWLSARVRSESGLLRQAAIDALERTCNGRGLDAAVHELECFAPAYPVPRHRFR